MTCLGFTSSTEHGSVALLHKNKITQLASWAKKEQASEALISKIKTGLHQKKISYSKLTLIAVDKGPGSFTGSRISVNVAKTLAYSLKIPIAAMSSLDILAFGFSKTLKSKESSCLFTLLDAHKSLFYFRAFDCADDKNLNPLNEIQALSLDQISEKAPKIGNLVLLGDVQNKIFKELKGKIQTHHSKLKIKIPTKIKNHYPQATSLVELATRIPESNFSSWREVEPSYIRSPDAVEKLKNL